MILAHVLINFKVIIKFVFTKLRFFSFWSNIWYKKITIMRLNKLAYPAFAQTMLGLNFNNLFSKTRVLINKKRLLTFHFSTVLNHSFECFTLLVQNPKHHVYIMDIYNHQVRHHLHKHSHILYKQILFCHLYQV